MSRSKSTDYIELLAVYSKGLALGIISKEEVVAWADKIIIQDAEPNYFFIEISLSSNAETLISVIREINETKPDIITIRVLFGILYHKLCEEEIEINKAVEMLDILNDWDILTQIEVGSIYSLEECNWFEPDVLEERLEYAKEFLLFYREFNIENYKNWYEINTKIDDRLAGEQKLNEKHYEQYLQKQKEYQQKELIEKKRKNRKKTFLISTLIPLPFILVIFFIIKYREEIVHQEVSMAVATCSIIILINTTTILLKKINKI